MEPLPLGEISATPWAFSPVWFVLVAVSVPALTWLGFAWRRAFEQDPNRVRRAGIRELQRLLRNVRRSHSSPRWQDLHGWCRATARAWNVRVSAPTAEHLARAMRSISDDAVLTATWHDLWRATERGLYAAKAAPPSDWLTRASSAAASLEVPRRDRWLPNRLTDWLPSAAAAVLVVAGVSALVTAGTALAEQPAATASQPTALEALPAAREALRKHWNDWAAHHNFAVAQAERGNWNVAAAHASAAFVQNPSSKATRESLRAALEQTGATDPALRRLVFGSVYQRFPTLLAPAGWQRFALAASLLLAAGLTGLVLTIYLKTRLSANDRRLMLTASAVTAAGLVLFITACGAWSAYGPLSQPNAGLLYQSSNLSPTPTELVPQQETSPAAAGSVVLTDRSFLGWRQVRVNEKASGWIRNNAVMPLYESSRH